MPSGFGGEFAAWLGGSGFGRLGTGPGLWRAWGPLEAGAQTHTASGLDRQLALVKPSASGLQVGEKECGAEESMGAFGGKSVGSWAHPPVFSLCLSRTHEQMSPEELAQQHITPSTIRLSIGTEHIDDIIDDLDQAFAQI